jgi:hypothetical protein
MSYVKCLATVYECHHGDDCLYVVLDGLPDSVRFRLDTSIKDGWNFSKGDRVEVELIQPVTLGYWGVKPVPQPAPAPQPGAAQEARPVVVEFRDCKEFVAPYGTAADCVTCPACGEGFVPTKVAHAHRDAPQSAPLVYTRQERADGCHCDLPPGFICGELGVRQCSRVAAKPAPAREATPIPVKHSCHQCGGDVWLFFVADPRRVRCRACSPDRLEQVETVASGWQPAREATEPRDVEAYCKCGHGRHFHNAYSDHDECVASDCQCCEFVAAPPPASRPQEGK